jgi:hypothetical protein
MRAVVCLARVCGWDGCGGLSRGSCGWLHRVAPLQRLVVLMGVLVVALIVALAVTRGSSSGGSGSGGGNGGAGFGPQDPPGSLAAAITIDPLMAVGEIVSCGLRRGVLRGPPATRVAPGFHGWSGCFWWRWPPCVCFSEPRLGVGPQPPGPGLVPFTVVGCPVTTAGD